MLELKGFSRKQVATLMQAVDAFVIEHLWPDSVIAVDGEVVLPSQMMRGQERQQDQEQVFGTGTQERRICLHRFRNLKVVSPALTM